MTAGPRLLTQDDVADLLNPILQNQVDGLDDDLLYYICGMLAEADLENEGDEDEDDEDDDGTSSPLLSEILNPFLDSVMCPPDLQEQANQVVLDMILQQQQNRLEASQFTTSNKLKQGIVQMKLHSDRTSSTGAAAEDETNRFLWGTDSKVHQNTNKTYITHDDAAFDPTSGKVISQKDRRKQRQELEKQRNAFEMELKKEREEQEEGSKNVVAAMVLPDYNSIHRNERNVQIQNVSLSLDNGKSLLDGGGELKFAYQRRYGLVGKNGVGKTTLLKAIASQQVDGVGVDCLKHMRILHVRQEIKAEGNDVSVLKAVLDSDVERLALLREEKELLARLEQNTPDDDDDATASTAGTSTASSVAQRRQKLLQQQKEGDAAASFAQDLKRLDQVYARLTVLAADSAEARASMILSGLQFTPEMQRGPTSALSGGWRMRVALAAALFIEPDLLMLDEPTNHLDLEAVLWLESYLMEYKHTVIVVSHDRGFLNQVVTDIIEFKNQRLSYYRGNYDTYVKTADELIRNRMRSYQAYQDKRAHLMEFIEKFRANAKRATMVQSRIKTVEKMDAEAPEPVEMETLWRFSIPNPEPIGRPIIGIDDVFFDYSAMTKLPSSAQEEGKEEAAVVPKVKKPSSEFLLQKVNFGVDLDSRIGILGANGAGKSTLLNLIMGHLRPVKGNVTINGRLRIGHFTQHSAEKFDLQLSSVENMLNLFDHALDQEMRSFLGKFQIQGTDALKPMMLLSGGQKSRVAFASLAYQKPHVIIMDEPTNHLDMESIDALVEAIKDFRGGLIVVSHDQYFISNTCSELWVVGDGVVSRFRGDFEEYKKHTLEKTRKRVEASVKSLSSI